MTELMTECVNAHELCHGGLGAPCPYCEPVQPFRDAETGRFVSVDTLAETPVPAPSRGGEGP